MNRAEIQAMELKQYAEPFISKVLIPYLNHRVDR
jgi:hypothetical protein